MNIIQKKFNFMVSEKKIEKAELETSEKKRPLGIIIVCLVGTIGSVLGLLLTFSSASSVVGTWYSPYLGFSAIIGLICMGGLWTMQKWSVYTYLGLFIINQVVFILLGKWTVLSLVIPLIVLVVAFPHLKKMTNPFQAEDE
jgi:hypothetical protein